MAQVWKVKLIDMGIRLLRPLLAITLLFLCFKDTSPAAAQQKTSPNIVLLTLDATRADKTGFLGSQEGLTPNLDRLAGGSMVFTQAYAQSPLTIASSATILTGTYPQTNRASALGVLLPASVPYLPERLHEHGYRTAAFVDSRELDPKNGPFQGYDHGFDSYSAQQPQVKNGKEPSRTAALPGEEPMSAALKWLPSGAAQPFFLWVHVSPPRSAAPNSYDRGIRAADQAVGQLVAALKQNGIFDNTVLVVAADHGESLGAHGEQTSGMFLYDEVIHVPLLLKLPTGRAGDAKRVSGRVRLLDIAPTLLELAGIAVPSAMQGQSLLRIAAGASPGDQPAYARSELPPQGFNCSTIESWRVGKYLFINSSRPELYDLADDPGALHNLAASAQARLQVLSAQVAAFDRHLAGNLTSSDAGLTVTEIQKLASLGYIGLQHDSGAVEAKPTGIDPKDAIGVANRTLAAFLALDDGKPQQAVDQFRVVLSERQDIYLAQYGMGVALSQQQKYAASIDFLRRAIKLQPQSAWAHYAMGVSLGKTGDFKTAAVHLEIASRLLPHFSAIHASLAEAYEHLGRSH